MQRIAVIAGDGIGTEVTTQALRALDTVRGRFGLDLEVEELDYGAERYLNDGTTLPKGEIERFRKNFAAIYLGALGDPRVPDMQHGREILLALRFELDLYINFRPVKCLADQFCPLKGKTHDAIDFKVFRENTEGIYVGVGGNFKKGTADEIAINEDINTRKGVERIIRAAFAYAQKNNLGRVTMSDKSNAMRYAHDLWQRVFKEVAQDYPTIEANHFYVDALAMALIRSPEQFEVIVTNNLFGDIVTDLAAELQGGMGMAASANINPDGLCLFEPVHGSAPDIAGTNKANPLAAILSMGMLLEHLEHREAAQAIENAVMQTLHDGHLSEDLGGHTGTSQMGDAIVERLSV